MVKPRTLVIIFLFVFVSKGTCQESATRTDGFGQIDGFTGRKIVATGMVGGLLIGSLVDAYYAWWKDASTPFTFHAEGWFATRRGIDKAGHFFTSYFHFHTFRYIMLWGGYEASTALWWAVGTSAFFAVSVEIGDGVTAYAFDYQDLAFNLGGIGYAILQTKIPFLRNFNFKWSFVPSDGYRFPPRFTEDYDAHTYWLTANVNELLPRSWEPFWPDFLQLAIGYGVDDNVTKSEVAVGFDINLEVFRTDNEHLLLAEKTLNMFHIPGPGVKFTESKKPRYSLFLKN